MFAVINHLHFTRPAEDFVEGLEKEGLPLLSSQPGFVDFQFVKVAPDKAIVVILWKDSESAQNGAKVFGPTWFAQNIAPNLASEQERYVGPSLVSYQK